jgi:hypothetical protein
MSHRLRVDSDEGLAVLDGAEPSPPVLQRQIKLLIKDLFISVCLVVYLSCTLRKDIFVFFMYLVQCACVTRKGIDRRLRQLPQQMLTTTLRDVHAMQVINLIDWQMVCWSYSIWQWLQHGNKLIDYLTACPISSSFRWQYICLCACEACRVQASHTWVHAWLIDNISHMPFEQVKLPCVRALCWLVVRHGPLTLSISIEIMVLTIVKAKVYDHALYYFCFTLVVANSDIHKHYIKVSDN